MVVAHVVNESGRHDKIILTMDILKNNNMFMHHKFIIGIEPWMMFKIVELWMKVCQEYVNRYVFLHQSATSCFYNLCSMYN